MKELLDPPKQVLIGPQALEGELVLPPRAQAIIVFAHGSGSDLRGPTKLLTVTRSSTSSCPDGV